MSYKVYAGIQTDIDTWATKVCIYDPGDISGTKKLISPTLTREVGKAGSFEATLPLGNVAHSALQKLRTTVEVEQDGKSIWQGRVMSHEQDFLMRQKVYCEGEMAYFNDSGAAPYSASNVSIRQFLEWVCDNHNAQVDAYKAFTPGKVEMDTPMIVPYIDGLKVELVGYHDEEHDDHEDRYYHYGIKDPFGGIYLFYEETENEKASCLKWTSGEEHYFAGSSSITTGTVHPEGYILTRTGENSFRLQLTFAYANGKTWKASVRIAEAKVSCATCNKSFGTHSIYDITKASEASDYKITEKDGTYTLTANGKVYSQAAFAVKEPTYTFGDGKGYGITLDILQDTLTDVYGGYLVIRHAQQTVTLLGKPITFHWRYLDYLQKITEKNDQTIAFGVNMLSLDSYVKAENIYTRVIAFGTTTSTGWLFSKNTSIITSTANDTAAQNLYGIITKVLKVDGNGNTKQGLQDAADEELAKNLRLLNGINLKAVDLKDAGIDISRIDVGKQTHIFSAPHGVDTWLLCSKIVEPLDAPDKKEFTIGTEFSSLSDLQALSSRKASDAYDLSRSLKGYVASS